MCVSLRLASEIVAGENRLAQFCNAILASRAESCTKKTHLLCEKFATWFEVCEYVRNKFDGSNHVEASVFTPEAIR